VVQVKLTKWHKNSKLPPFAAKIGRNMGKVDRWNTVQMKIPARLLRREFPFNARARRIALPLP
jgi:hypothetical protein